MQNQSKHKFARGLVVGILFALLLVLSLGVGVKFSSPIKIWVASTLGAEEKEEVNFSELTYAALGDSITAGSRGKLSGVFSGYMDTPYCVLVKDELGLKSVTNYGISSSTISSGNGYVSPMVERYDEMDETDIISVMGGINDYGKPVALGAINDTETTTFYGALNTLAKGLKEKSPNAFIFFMTPLSVPNFAPLLLKYCQAMKEVCAKYDIPVLDTNSLCDFSLEYNSVGYTGDGVHPSEEFHRDVLAPLIADFIKDNYCPAEAN